MKVLNLTKQACSSAMSQAGVAEPTTVSRQRISDLLTVMGPGIRSDLIERAKELVSIADAEGASHAFISGHPAVMHFLREALEWEGITPIYSLEDCLSVLQSTEYLIRLRGEQLREAVSSKMADLLVADPKRYVWEGVPSVRDLSIKELAVKAKSILDMTNPCTEALFGDLVERLTHSPSH